MILKLFYSDCTYHARWLDLKFWFYCTVPWYFLSVVDHIVNIYFVKKIKSVSCVWEWIILFLWDSFRLWTQEFINWYNSGSGSKHADTKKKYVHLANLSEVRTKNIKLYNDTDQQVLQKIKLNFPCNRTVMTLCFFPWKTSKSIGIPPGKLWSCSWYQCALILIWWIFTAI